MFSTSDLFDQRHDALIAFGVAPIAILVAVLARPRCCAAASRRARGGCRRGRRARGGDAGARRAARLPVAARGRDRDSAPSCWPGRSSGSSCYVLLVALGLDDRAGIGAAAAVLFAVNVTAVLPATPSNLGVFQAACVAVLAGAYGVASADALAYGIVLQAVELATAVVMGAPALLKEGLSWRDVRCGRCTPARCGSTRCPARRPARGRRPEPTAAKAARMSAAGPGSTSCAARTARCTAAGRATSTGGWPPTPRGGPAATRAAGCPSTLAAALPMPDRAAARREEARIKRLPRTEKLALVDGG